MQHVITVVAVTVVALLLATVGHTLLVKGNLLLGSSFIALMGVIVGFYTGAVFDKEDS